MPTERQQGRSDSAPSDTDRAAEIVAPMGDATLLKGVAAVILGFMVLTIGAMVAGRWALSLSGDAPLPEEPAASFTRLSLAARGAVAILAGYLTAAAAPRARFAHAGVLAGLLVLISAAALIGLGTSGGLAGQGLLETYGILLVGPPAVLLGGWLRTLRAGGGRAGLFLLLGITTGSAGCRVEPIEPRSDLIADFPAFTTDSLVHAVIEIPAGSDQKWEVTKPDGVLEWEREGGVPRRIRYLPYPANYGMVPRTLLPAEGGGDGDPLDIIVLGPAVERGQVIPVRPVGILRLRDGGERDDKILAASVDGPFSGVTSLGGLRTDYPGALEIIELWFTSYKGRGVLESTGYGSALEARDAVREAALAYEDRVSPSGS